MKWLRSTTLGCKDIGIRTFVEMNQFPNIDEWTLDNGHLIVVKNSLHPNQCKGKHNETIFYTFKYEYSLEKIQPILMFIPVLVLYSSQNMKVDVLPIVLLC